MFSYIGKANVQFLFVVFMTFCFHFINGPCPALSQEVEVTGRTTVSSVPVEPEMEPCRLKITGEFIIGDKPISGVKMTASNGGTTDVTDIKGQFTVEVPYGWSGELTPTKKGWQFDPPSKPYEYVTQNIDERSTTHEVDNETVPKWADPSQWWHPSPPEPSVAPGRLGVSPMVLSLEGESGTELKSQIRLQNLGSSSATVKLSLKDLCQQDNGNLKAEELLESDPRWITSCRSWISFEKDTLDMVRLAPVDVTDVVLTIQIPEQAQRLYHAAVVLELTDGDHGIGVCHQFIIPVLLHVRSGASVHKVHLLDSDIVVDEAESEYPTAYARLCIENQGNTMPMVGASIGIEPLDSMGRSLDCFELTLGKVRILPGARLVLETDRFDRPSADRVKLTGHISLLEDYSFEKTVSFPVDLDPGPETLSLGRSQPFLNASIGEDKAIDLSTSFAMVDYGYSLYVTQLINCPDPYHTYAGGLRLGMATNIPTVLEAAAQARSVAQGRWVTRLKPGTVSGLDTTKLDLHVCGTNVRIDRLPGGTKNVEVAEITIRHTPALSALKSSFPPAGLSGLSCITPPRVSRVQNVTSF